ncbi:hypothetical protein C8Q75DRAFT_727589 [Abortiporus biennis]|nr:hypothetical protein C8Q75DRAFT_727589 [Abortiporus biennis]
MVPALTCQTFVISGLTVDVYSYPQLNTTHTTAKKRPLVVQFLLHSAFSSSKKTRWVVESFFEKLAKKREGTQAVLADLLIITFDHRNHGVRLVDQIANYPWSKIPERNNDRHAIDMYAIEVGTALDACFLVDFLPSYLFPNNERVVTEWVIAGLSLGGHSAWIALARDRRFRVGIPIIGAADYVSAITHIAKRSNIPMETPYFPDSLYESIKIYDPPCTSFDSPSPDNPFLGKKILAIYAEKDDLVPWAVSKDFFERLHVGGQGSKRAIVMEKVKHQVTPRMIDEWVGFVWDVSLRPAAELTATSKL